ncbi:hypothetical protein IF1G_04730 [Cordyceps javanica]|uniref:Uncharacterized protein n=1 Tax=Cordyceps javanica TaxID=43265 RepID=A0A545V361_9HYPO|nr:hypothetical protein IF1G_04730 [Cordyceps javanica]
MNVTLPGFVNKNKGGKGGGVNLDPQMSNLRKRSQSVPHRLCMVTNLRWVRIYWGFIVSLTVVTVHGTDYDILTATLNLQEDPCSLPLVMTRQRCWCIVFCLSRTTPSRYVRPVNLGVTQNGYKALAPKGEGGGGGGGNPLFDWPA